MERRIPSLDEFINESANRIKTVRPVKEILKDFQQSKYYNHIGIFEIEQWGRVTALAADSSLNKELAAIFLTDGNDPDTDQGVNKLGEKLRDAWNKLFTLDNKMKIMRNEHLEKMNAKFNNETVDTQEPYDVEKLISGNSELSVTLNHKMIHDCARAYQIRTRKLQRKSPDVTPDILKIVDSKLTTRLLADIANTTLGSSGDYYKAWS